MSFWDKVACEYREIDFDSSLVAAINMYWGIRRLPLVVSVTNKPRHVTIVPTDVAIIDIKSSQMLICSTEIKSNLVARVLTDVITSAPTNDPTSHVDDPWGENDEIAYVGIDDEPVEPASNTSCDYIPDTDEEDNDDCVVDDQKGCELVGVTFEDRDTFMRAIRQYAILNEIEIAAPYNEAKRFTGYYKSSKCKWRIHASQL